MSYRSDPADGKARLHPDQCGVRLSKRFTGTGRGFLRIHPIATRRQKQNRVFAGFGAKDDGFGNLIEMAPNAVSGFLRGAGLSHFADVDRQTGRLQGGTNTFEALAHIGVLSRRLDP